MDRHVRIQIDDILDVLQIEDAQVKKQKDQIIEQQQKITDLQVSCFPLDVHSKTDHSAHSNESTVNTWHLPTFPTFVHHCHLQQQQPN